MNWLRRLFSRSKVHKKHTFLTKEEVGTIENYFTQGTHTTEDIQKIYGVSKATLYKIQCGEHRFSTKE